MLEKNDESAVKGFVNKIQCIIPWTSALSGDLLLVCTYYMRARIHHTLFQGTMHGTIVSVV